MRVYTTHFRAGRDPLLIREGFSWPGFLFGFLYFAATGAWVAAALSLALTLLLGRASAALGTPAVLLGFLVLQGILAQDIRRFALDRTGWRQGPVVAARSPEEALGRVIGARPDLAAEAGRA